MNELSSQLRGEAARLLPYWEEDGISDLLVNGVQSFYVEKSGQLERRESPFLDAAELWSVVERLVVAAGKRWDTFHPFIDGILADGSRFHIVMPPLSPRGPSICIRRFSNPERVPLAAFHSDATVIVWLQKQIALKKNLLVVGATGAGKTTLLSRLVDEIPETERVVLIEECAEIATAHPHTVSLEARAPTTEGLGGVNLRDLVRQALRMRPNRIVVGECRAGESFDMLQAMACGHPGSLSTMHARSAKEALFRLETLVAMGNVELPLPFIRRWISSAIDTVVFVSAEGRSRQIREIVEIHGLEGEMYALHPILPAL